jgi:hypothetical protein
VEVLGLVCRLGLGLASRDGGICPLLAGSVNCNGSLGGRGSHEDLVRSLHLILHSLEVILLTRVVGVHRIVYSRHFQVMHAFAA